jgi:hypothetical protein
LGFFVINPASPTIDKKFYELLIGPGRGTRSAPQGCPREILPFLYGKNWKFLTRFPFWSSLMYQKWETQRALKFYRPIIGDDTDGKTVYVVD